MTGLIRHPDSMMLVRFLDESNKEYLRELNKAIEANKKVTDAAEEICTCANCVESRLKKEISTCDKNRVLENLPSKMFRTYPGNYIRDFSPSSKYWGLNRS